MAINTQNAELKMSAGNIKQFPAKVIPQVAFSGRSNVGKSSLINTLLGRKSLARVSSSPGKTITINFYEIDGKLSLVDLPGYGFAKRPPAEKEKWSALTDGYFTKNPNIDLLKLVVQLIDIRAGATADDMMMLDFLSRSSFPFIVAATKTDKLSKTELEKSLAALNQLPLLSGIKIVPFSSVTRAGKDALWNEIFTHCKL